MTSRDASAAPIRLLGREQVLRKARAALDGGARLLTLCGAPGMGKTTLLGALAADPAEWVPCDLMMIRGADDLAAAVARALRLDLGPTVDRTNVGDVLRVRGPMGLALDHAESLSGPAIQVLADWLATVPSLRIVAGSRTTLGLPIEEVLAIESLALADAVTLFIDRAARVQPALVLGKTAARVEAIVSKLDGMPLAIELAAARMAVLSLEALEEGLADRFALLRAPRGVAVPHHASLWSALELSWGLLSEAERQMLGAAAVFRGGFTLEAVQAVLGGVEGPPILDRLHALREHSLLITRPDAAGLRFDLLESVREFGAAHLSDEERTLREDRHALHYVQAAEERLPTLWGRSRAEAIRWFADERFNLLVSEERLRARAPELAARAALAVNESISRDGPLSLSRRLVEGALASAERSGDPWLVARALGARGLCSWLSGDAIEAVRSLERALTLAQPVRDETAVAAWERWLAFVRFATFDFDGAERGCQRCIDLARACGAIHSEGTALAVLALIALDREDFARARVLAKEAHDLALATEDPLSLWEADLRRCEVELYAGDAAAARVLFEAGERRAARDQSRGPAEEHLGWRAVFEGRRAEAREHFRLAAGMFEQSLGGAQGTLRGALAVLDALDGHLDQASEAIGSALPILRREGQRRNELFYGACLAAIEAARGVPEDARERVRMVSEACPAAAVSLRRVTEAVSSFVAIAWAGVLSARGQREPARRALAEASSWWRSRDRLRAGGLSTRVVQDLLDTLARHVVVGAPWREPDADPVPIGVTIEVDEPSERLEWTRALRVAQDGAYFRLEGGGLVDLTSRKALAEALAILVRARVEEPGKVVDRAALGAGRGGGKVQVQTTIRRLRAMGLRDVILEHEGGYAIDPALAVVRVRNWG